MGRALDLRGLSVGGALVTRPVGKKANSGAIVWEVICACGRVQHRAAGNIVRSHDTGAPILCPTCLAESWKVRALERSDARMAFFVKVIAQINPHILSSPQRTRSMLRILLDQFGLYGAEYDRFEEAGIRKEIAEKLEEPPALLEVSSAEMLYPDSGDEPGGTDWSVLYPMAARSGHALFCESCEAEAQRGWGCVKCEGFYCYDCVVGEKHHCNHDWVTLRRVGKILDGTSPERIRQIESNGIGKMQHAIAVLDEQARVRRLIFRDQISRRDPRYEIEMLNRAAEEEQGSAEQQPAEQKPAKRVGFDPSLRALVELGKLAGVGVDDEHTLAFEIEEDNR